MLVFEQGGIRPHSSACPTDTTRIGHLPFHGLDEVSTFLDFNDILLLFPWVYQGSDDRAAEVRIFEAVQWWP